MLIAAAAAIDFNRKIQKVKLRSPVRKGSPNLSLLLSSSLHAAASSTTLKSTHWTASNGRYLCSPFSKFPSPVPHVVLTFLSFLLAFSPSFSLGIDLLFLTAAVSDLAMRARVLLFVLFLAVNNRRKAADENPRLVSGIAFGS